MEGADRPLWTLYVRLGLLLRWHYRASSKDFSRLDLFFDLKQEALVRIRALPKNRTAIGFYVGGIMLGSIQTRFLSIIRIFLLNFTHF